MENKNVIALFCVMWLTACGGGSSSNGGTVGIDCATVYNTGGADTCAVVPKVGYAAKVTIVDAGTVTRGTEITVSMNIANTTATPFNGYVEATFDGGCNGAATWPIVTQQPITVAANTTDPWGVVGMCTDMPLGARTLIGKLYDADGTTVLDEAHVMFTLTL